MTHVILVHQTPFEGDRARSTLDLVLATSAFNEDISVIFLDDGVFQLIDNQQPDPALEKGTHKLIAAFELYELRAVFAEKRALAERAINLSAIPDNIRLIDKQELHHQINAAHKVSHFS